MASANSNRLSRDEYKKKKELDELRKAGTLAPEVDEDGKEINPHIPQYISQAPWYLNAETVTLKHQKSTIQHIDGTKDWYQRGKKAGPAATKWAKGACENCGARTHKTKECMERPRKLGAKHTNQDLKPDEVITDLVFDYDGKRDRWNGYDTANHVKLMEESDMIEELRRQKKSEQLDSAFMTEPDADQARFPHEGKKKKREKKKKKEGQDLGDESDSDESDSGSDDEVKEREGFNNAPMQKIDTKFKSTVRNLRIREDTAKYLLNLDVNSAFYDPKTRAMRADPRPDADPNDVLFHGENKTRITGDTVKHFDINSFAWNAYEKGTDIQMETNPTQTELLHAQFKDKKVTLKEERKNSVLEKYGGEEHLQSFPKELLLGQTEQFTLYTRDGRLVGGHEKAIPRSKYEEDVLTQNHTAVWGSFWSHGQWGYACCHQFLRNAYCLGEAGKSAANEAILAMQNRVHEEEAARAREKYAEEAEKRKKEREAEEAPDAKEKRLKNALKEEKKRAKMVVEDDDRKRKYNSMEATNEVTDEQMEAYYLSKRRDDDPMANMANAV